MTTNWPSLKPNILAGHASTADTTAPLASFTSAHYSPVSNYQLRHRRKCECLSCFRVKWHWNYAEVSCCEARGMQYESTTLYIASEPAEIWEWNAASSTQNQLLYSFCQPNQSCLDSPTHSLVNPSSASINHSLFHSRLKTYLFNISFPPFFFTHWTALMNDNGTGPDLSCSSADFLLISLFFTFSFTFFVRSVW